MTATFITTNILNAGGFAYTANGDDQLVVFQGINLASSLTTAARITGSDNHALVSGSIIGLTDGMNVGTFAKLDSRNQIEVTSTGFVGGVTGFGIRLIGYSSGIENAGEISGSYGISILSSDVSGFSRNFVANSGTIRGEEIGISGFNALRTEIANTGTIIDGDDFDHLELAGGEVLYVKGAIFIRGDEVKIANSGSIIGTTDYSYGIFVEGDDTEIINSGLVQSNNVFINNGAIDVVNEAGDAALIKNTVGGRIVSPNTAIDTLDGDDTVINSGAIDGDVRLGGGDDLFDTRNGSLSGTVEGFAGNDILKGSAAADHMDGGADNDTLTGGNGDDTLLGADGKDWAHGGTGNDRLDGNAGNDTLKGGSGDDTLAGGDNNDLLQGQKGEDNLFGDAGSDTLNGGAGNDTLDGGGKGDRLNGGGGDDVQTGGGGADTFVFDRKAGDDIITDMVNGQDRIDLTAFGLQNFNRLNTLNALSAEAGGVLIDLDALGGSGSIWLDGFAIGTLNAGDFII